MTFCDHCRSLVPPLRLIWEHLSCFCDKSVGSGKMRSDGLHLQEQVRRSEDMADEAQERCVDHGDLHVLRGLQIWNLDSRCIVLTDAYDRGSRQLELRELCCSQLSRRLGRWIISTQRTGSLRKCQSFWLDHQRLLSRKGDLWCGQGPCIIRYAAEREYRITAQALSHNFE